jgi:NAD(P)-dependent dehydrogenase (short-subunit alcohol dehydrogenase family)
MKPLIVALFIFSAISPARAATVFITGSDKGLGLEFVRQYAARGDNVIATCRHPDEAKELEAIAAVNRRVIVEKLDVSKDADIRAIAAKYKGHAIDILINNAGVLGGREEQTLGTLDRKAFHDVVDVNSFAPLAVSEALRDNVVASRQKKIITVTSGLGSITVAGGMPRGPYYYRMSKAAVNMGMRALGADLKSQGVVVAVVAPGGVATEMNAEFRRDYLPNAKIPPAKTSDAIAKMIGTIDKVDQGSAEQGIVQLDGSIMPW